MMLTLLVQLISPSLLRLGSCFPFWVLLLCYWLCLFNLLALWSPAVFLCGRHSIYRSYTFVGRLRHRDLHIQAFDTRILELTQIICDRKASWLYLLLSVHFLHRQIYASTHLVSERCCWFYEVIQYVQERWTTNSRPTRQIILPTSLRSSSECTNISFLDQRHQRDESQYRIVQYILLQVLGLIYSCRLI